MNMVQRDQDRTFASEFQLALACARWPQTDLDQSEIRRLASRSLNWEWFERIIQRNQIVPLAYHNLREALPDKCPAEVFDSLRERAMGQVSRSMSQAAELVRITESLKSAGVESVALKGVSLSAAAYGNCALRSPGDIDLLVSASDVFDVERILADLGYARHEPRAELTPKRLKHYLRYHKHFTYFSEAKALPVELHWRLFDRISFSEEAAEFPPTMPVSLGCGVVSTLSRSELFLYLCVHGAIHGWTVLKWLADIAALLSGMTTDDFGLIATLASQRGLMAELLAAVMLVDHFLAVEPPNFEPPRESNPAVERIVGMAKRLLTAKGYCLEIHQLPRFAMIFYELRLRSSYRYRSEGIWRALFYPADWYLIGLPDALFPLYAAVRPVSWLLRHFPHAATRRHLPDGSSHHLSS